MRFSIGLLGDLDTSRPTHRELEAAVELFSDDFEPRWIATDSREARELDGLDGLWVFPGSPYRDDDAVLAAIEWALDAKTPFLGTCSGFQYAVLVLARRAGITGAAHAEMVPSAGGERALDHQPGAEQGKSGEQADEAPATETEYGLTHR